MSALRTTKWVVTFVAAGVLAVAYFNERTERIRLEQLLVKVQAIKAQPAVTTQQPLPAPESVEEQVAAKQPAPETVGQEPAPENNNGKDEREAAEFSRQFDRWRIQNEIDEIESMTVLSSEQKEKLEKHFKREYAGENVVDGLVEILGEQLARELEKERERRSELDLAERVETEAIRLGRKLQLAPEQEEQVRAALEVVHRDTRNAVRELFSSLRRHPEPGDRRETFEEVRRIHNERVQEKLQPLLNDEQYNLLLQEQAERSQRRGFGRYYR